MSDFHYNFYKAREHRKNFEFGVAEKFCADALKSEPNHLGALSLYAEIKAVLGHHDEAKALYAKAAEVAPENKVSLLNLGSSLKGMGDFDGAQDLLLKAIKLDKTFAPAYYTLAGIRKFKPGDPLIADFEYMKKRVYGNALYRCVACFALGKIYNDIGEYDLAFENYDEGNKRRRARFDYNELKAVLNGLRKAVPPSALKDYEGLGHPSKKPVFVVGMPRSGSSLIEDLLSRSGNIVGLGEPPDIEYLFNGNFRLKRAPETGAVEFVREVQPFQFRAIGEQYLNYMHKFSKDADRMVDKNLFNHAFVGFIRIILPNASIIHTTRDPIDTCLSCYFQNFTEGHDYSYDLVKLGQQYAAYVDIMSYWQEMMGDQIFEAPYEKVIEDKDAAIDQLYAHIGLTAPEKSSLEQPADRAIPTASAWQARQPIYKTSVKRWKNYEKHLGPLFESLEASGFKYEG